MTDNSDRIIILSFILLIFIAIQSPSNLTGKRIGTLNDIEVEIHTSQDEYVLGEDFTATVYLINNDPYDIWISTPNFYMIDANSLNNPEPLLSEVYVTKDKDSLLHIPANSSVKFDNIHCYPQYTGEFQIYCIGGKKAVLILDPPSEGETVNAMMNKHSFKNTDEATLFITNVGLNRITLGDIYEIQKMDGYLWVEVPASLHHPNIWLMYLALLDSGNVFRQEVTIDKLEPGLYKIRKEVFDEVTRELSTLIVEFEILG